MVERMKKTFDLYLFNDDESATIFDDPVLTDVDENIEELSKEQLTKIVVDILKDNSEYTSLEEIEDAKANWSEEKLAQSVWDVGGLIFDSAAVIDSKHRETLKVVADVLFKQFGDDSSTYRACESFATLLKSLAVKIIPFPSFDGEKYYQEMV